MRLHKNSISKVNLTDILRRRKKSLQQFLDETGIVTYELLKERCRSMGVSPPDEEQFLNVMGRGMPEVSSPAEGVIVIAPHVHEEVKNVEEHIQVRELTETSLTVVDKRSIADKKKSKKTADDSTDQTQNNSEKSSTET